MATLGFREAPDNIYVVHYFCINEKCELYMTHVWHERWNRRLAQLEKVQRFEPDAYEGFLDTAPAGKYMEYDDVETLLRS